MKKYIPLSLIAIMLGVLIPASIQAASITKGKGWECITLSRDLSYGSNDKYLKDGQVTMVQSLMKQQGFYKADLTGYFNPATVIAVKNFQKKYNISQTGYVGPKTRAQINSMVCRGEGETPGQPATSTPSIESVVVTSPKGGEVWVKGTTQKITWTDSRTYIQAPKYDIKIQRDLDCKEGQACILLYPMPQTIVKNILNSEGYLWRVGVTQVDVPSVGISAPLPSGKYRIFVCPTGLTEEDLTGCAKSASYVTIQ